MHLVFKFAPEADPQATLKLKVEINTREHEPLFGVKSYPFAVDSDWYQGKAEIPSFEFETQCVFEFAHVDPRGGHLDPANAVRLLARDWFLRNTVPMSYTGVPAT